MIRFRIIYQNSNIEAPEGRFDIGRSLECHLVLDDPSVSRVHATIIREKDQLLLEDRGSRNGCTLNGNQVSGVVRLQDGDMVGIGHQRIRIAAFRDSARAATSTLGLVACRNCGVWGAMGDDFCGQCGHPFQDSGRPTDTAQLEMEPEHMKIGHLPTEETINSGDMLAGLAKKALSKNKPDDALKLTQKMMEGIEGAKESSREAAEVELEKVANLLIDIAIHSSEPERISQLFVFFTQIRRLLPRKSVERLYSIARGTGYRTSSELHQYIACLADLSGTFSPGEKFIYRRIEGLASLCN
ncbi:MAG: FHA domain-containing protein [Deltaproteobacteria bacterium]|nr:FHA domain-containing protein [Deltaproteobacteria bacterium]